MPIAQPRRSLAQLVGRPEVHVQPHAVFGFVTHILAARDPILARKAHLQIRDALLSVDIQEIDNIPQGIAVGCVLGARGQCCGFDCRREEGRGVPGGRCVQRKDATESWRRGRREGHGHNNGCLLVEFRERLGLVDEA